MLFDAGWRATFDVTAGPTIMYESPDGATAAVYVDYDDVPAVEVWMPSWPTADDDFEMHDLLTWSAFAKGGRRVLVAAKAVSGAPMTGAEWAAAAVPCDDVAPALAALTVGVWPDGWDDTLLTAALAEDMRLTVADLDGSLTEDDDWAAVTAVLLLAASVMEPTGILKAWALEGTAAVGAAALARNPRCPERLLHEFALHDDERVRRAVAGNVAAPEAFRSAALLSLD